MPPPSPLAGPSRGGRQGPRGEPTSRATRDQPHTDRAEAATASKAVAGSSWPAVTNKDAASSGSVRPNGLNGSCMLSPPAATLYPCSVQRRQGGQAAAAWPPLRREPGGKGWSGAAR